LRRSDGSVVLKENQFYDVSADSWRLHGCSATSQVVRLSGRWGADLGGCGIFRVVRQDNPVNRGELPEDDFGGRALPRL